MQVHRKLTYEIVKQEFIDRGYILVTTEYKNNSQHLEYICPKHEERGILKITFANFTQGKGCPYCAKRVVRTQEEYIHDLAQKHPSIIPIGQYKNLKTKIDHKCLVCGHIWSARPDNFLHSDNGCPKCSRRAAVTNEEFIQRVLKIDDSIEPLDEYTAHAIKIRFKCRKCSFVWQAKPNNILNGKGCPKCASSKGEKLIAKTLEENKVNFIHQWKDHECKHVHVLPFDFYLPEYNICIEYDGKQHFEPATFGGMSKEEARKAFEETKFRDNIKNKYCENNGIQLIRISYKQYKEINQIITSILH